jgi:hypothetical protein
MEVPCNDDLQDDLADTVIWLAENWSGDLPVPEIRPNERELEDGEHVPYLQLLVHCETAAELAPVIDRLASPRMSSAESDAQGRGDQPGTRRFGRVHIIARTPGSGPRFTRPHG